MMCSRSCCAVLAIAVAFIAYKVSSLIDTLGFSTVVSNQLRCVNIGSEDIVGSEDIAHWRDGIVLAAAGDLGTTYAWGASDAVPGGIFAVRASGAAEGEPTHWRVEVVGKGTDSLSISERYGMQLHGLYLSNSTQRLYAISHSDEKSGTGVHIFDIESLPQFPWLRLQHIKWISSPLFGNHALNDVTEGGASGEDLYVTNWVSFPHPIGGEVRGSALEKFKAGLGIPLQILGVPLTVVYRCMFDTGECSIAARGFLGANGITINDERSLVFVVDPGAKAVHVYHRDQSTGALSFSHTIETKHPGNNVEYVPASHTGGSAMLWLGIMPKLHLNIDMVDAQKTKPQNGLRPDGVANVPSGLSSIPIDANGHPVVGMPETLLYHDGSDVSMIAAAIRVGETVVLGQDFLRGVGVCKELP